jgi:hypothetical protein
MTDHEQTRQVIEGLLTDVQADCHCGNLDSDDVADALAPTWAEMQRERDEAKRWYEATLSAHATPEVFNAVEWAVRYKEERAIRDDYTQRVMEAEARAAQAEQERDKAVRRSEVRQRMIDIPTAWELTLATDKDQHHERCSYRTAGMLCDCAACNVMERVSGLLAAANQRAEAAEAERDALRRVIDTVRALRFHLIDPRDRTELDRLLAAETGGSR